MGHRPVPQRTVALKIVLSSLFSFLGGWGVQNRSGAFLRLTHQLWFFPSPFFWCATPPPLWLMLMDEPFVLPLPFPTTSADASVLSPSARDHLTFLPLSPPPCKRKEGFPFFFPSPPRRQRSSRMTGRLGPLPSFFFFLPSGGLRTGPKQAVASLLLSSFFPFRQSAAVWRGCQAARILPF